LITSIANSQTFDSISKFRKNLIKLNLLAAGQFSNGHNEKWVGVEYERFINQKMSVALMSDVGLFEDYIFIKYYDFFDEHGGFAYTQKRTKTVGYHLLPSFRYYLWITKSKNGQGIYVSGLLDFNQYFKNSELYHSSSKTYSYTSASTTRLGFGASLGGQYIAFSRLVIDLNISLFARVFDSANQQNASEIEPLNAIWISNENKAWVTVNFMIGYAFGGGKGK
jgi:hypothetical protein